MWASHDVQIRFPVRYWWSSCLKKMGVGSSVPFITRLYMLWSLLLPLYTAAANLIGDIVLTTLKNSCLKDALDSDSSCKHAVFVLFLFCFHVHSNEFVLAHEAFLCYKKKSPSVERPALSPTTVPLSPPVNILNPKARLFCLLQQCWLYTYVQLPV